jgi:hypothetical protein
MTMIEVKPTAFQTKVLLIPHEWNVLLAGGRGAGKSTALCLRAIRHLVKFGSGAKILIIRESYKSLEQISEQMVGMMQQAFPDRIKYNRSEHIARVLEGGTVEFGQLETAKDLNKYLGRECTLLAVDEFGLLKDPKWVTLLKSNLRSPVEGMPLACIYSCNPGGASHNFIHKKYIGAGLAWTKLLIDNEPWVVTNSNYLDNPHLDQDSYRRNLIAACANDSELLKAWETGSWSINRGAFFGEDFDYAIHVLPRELPFEITPRWIPRVSLDWGSSAPAVALFYGYCPGPEAATGIPTGTIVVFDEVSTHDPRDLSFQTGLRWPPSMLGDAIREKCNEYRMSGEGFADDAQALLNPQDSLIQFFQREYQLTLRKPESKSRISGWAAIRNRLAATRDRTGKPGLLISEKCVYLLATLPHIQRNQTRIEDLDTQGPDHGCDALRYAANSQPQIWRYSRKAGE